MNHLCHCEYYRPIIPPWSTGRGQHTENLGLVPDTLFLDNSSQTAFSRGAADRGEGRDWVRPGDGVSGCRRRGLECLGRKQSAYGCDGPSRVCSGADDGEGEREGGGGGEGERRRREGERREEGNGGGRTNSRSTPHGAEVTVDP